MSEARIFLGTCAFTASGWQGAFYPKGMRPADCLSYYAEHFDTVEIDSTFYACPNAKTVANWYDKTPREFIFSVKVPQSIMHDKILLHCQDDLVTYVQTIEL